MKKDKVTAPRSTDENLEKALERKGNKAVDIVWASSDAREGKDREGLMGKTAQ